MRKLIARILALPGKQFRQMRTAFAARGQAPEVRLSLRAAKTEEGKFGES